MKKVTIYSTPICPYCRRAKSLLTDLNIEYDEIDLASDETLRNEMIRKYNWQTVPMIFVGTDFIGGFDELVSLHADGKLVEMLK
jgi:glutaredoxin 3